jgi:hypothetical protein
MKEVRDPAAERIDEVSGRRDVEAYEIDDDVRHQQCDRAAEGSIELTRFAIDLDAAHLLPSGKPVIRLA